MVLSPSRPTTPGRGGVWEPLPAFVYGYAVHPLSPSHRDTRISHRPRLSTVTESSVGESSFLHRDVVSLEVGDEVYAFERYTGREGEWYRGYVVCTTRRPAVVWNAVDAGPKLEEAQQVFIGIFPASHIHRRDELPDAEGRLAVVAHEFAQGKRPPPSIIDDRESRKSFKLGPPPDQAGSSRAGLSVYPASVRSASPESHLGKPLPPRPTLKPGDETESGALQPIVDEIASALREWHMLMFQYLARRDYNKFNIVKDHIDALHLSRRQLLANTLSVEETAAVRAECVTRLVAGNLVQGLDVIVRHPQGGGLVTVDVEGELDPRNWMSTVRMFALQAGLAYMSPDSPKPALPSPTPLRTQTSFENLSSAPLPTPALSAFPEFAARSPVPKSATTPRTFGPSTPLESPTSPPDAVKFFHVFFEMRAFVASPCAPGETAELFFSLYNKHDARFVTEEFCAVLNHNGVMARDPTSRVRTLFAELAPSDVEHPLFLVCRIVRNGALRMGNAVSSSELARRTSGSVYNEKDGHGPEGITSPRLGGTKELNGNGSDNAPFRRPFGCAVLELTQVGRMSPDQDASATREFTMPIFSPVNEAIFSMLHQDIIAGNNKEFEKTSRADSMAVSIKVFHGNAERIARENTTLLQDTPRTLRLGFPDVVFPGDTRNELYIKLWSGEFPSARDKSVRGSVSPFVPRSSSSSGANNIQVSLEVRDGDGRLVPDALSPGAGQPPVPIFHSLVFARNSQPTFGELIKVALPQRALPRWHLFFTFRQRRPGSTTLDRPFAFAFLPLSSRGAHTFLEDGGHTLVLYRADRMGQLTPDVYLEAPASLPADGREPPAIPPEMARVAPALRDVLVIRSSLCSARHTQNTVLLSLLHWQALAQDPALLKDALSKFTFVNPVEIVKFLRDVFDALFGIMTSPANASMNGEMDAPAFDALVTVLGIVQDRRFSNFRPVLDVYIREHFHHYSAGLHLLNSLNRLLMNPTSNETASQLRAALKVWPHIFALIARARELQKERDAGVGAAATADHLEHQFRRELKTHLGEVGRMMGTSSPPSIIGTQTLALRAFPRVLPALGSAFNPLELVGIAVQFANALPNHLEKGKMAVEKLVLYLRLVKSSLFADAAARAALVETVVLWLKPHCGAFDTHFRTLGLDEEEAPEGSPRRDAARVGWLERIRLCVGIVAVMLDSLQSKLVDPLVSSDRRALRQEQDNVEFLLSLLPRLLESYAEFTDGRNAGALERVRGAATAPASVPVIFPESYPFSLVALLPGSTHGLFSPAQSETAVVLLALILSSPKKHLVNFFESILEIEGRLHFSRLLRALFDAGKNMLDNAAWPRNWLNVNILAHKVLVRAMDGAAVLLTRSFVPGQNPDEDIFPFDRELWSEGLQMLLKLLSSDQLLIEELTSQKRRAVWRLAGDIRGDGAAILLTLWDALGWPEDVCESHGVVTRFGGFQTELAGLVGPVVDLCVSHHDQLRNNAVQMLYSMIISQWHAHGHFSSIENELVSKLDGLFMSGAKGDDVSRAFFITQLRQLFESSAVDKQLQLRVSEFMDSVDQFLELLLSVRALPEGEEYADDRVIATLRLMNFIRRIGRNEMYIKYVHQLVNMHLQAQNYVEAALTLKLHADLHEWDLNSFAEPMEDLGLPQQSQFHRKETLHLLILDYLGKGKAWESAIEMCKELAFQHQEVTFNYGRLAEIMRHQASLLELIVTEQRYYPDYFRVAFFGNFPTAIRNKQFIYRGFDWEKFGAFCERMLGKHPGARLLRSASDPPVDIRFGGDQYIQCSPVVPEPDQTLAIFTNPDVPIAVRTYYEHSAIRLFSSSRQVTRLDREGNEETWVEKTYFTTEEIFPTVLRRSEIITAEMIEISPVETALHDVEARNKELGALNTRYAALARTGQIVSTNPLSMTLNSVVDAPANGGIISYREIFLAPDYLEHYPERAEHVEKLRDAIDTQVRIIDNCLRLHGQLCPPEMLAFHDTLEKFFRKNFSEEIHRLTFDGPAEQHPAVAGTRSRKPSEASPYAAANARMQSDAISIAPSVATTHRGGGGAPAFPVPPLPSRASVISSPSSLGTIDAGTYGTAMSSISYGVGTGSGSGSLAAGSKQTPLQRGLARLTRHGINSVVGSVTNDGSDGMSVAESPSDSFVNVSQSTGNLASQGAIGSSASIVGSISGSIKGRFSRLGALSFGRGGA